MEVKFLKIAVLLPSLLMSLESKKGYTVCMKEVAIAAWLSTYLERATGTGA